MILEVLVIISEYLQAMLQVLKFSLLK